jgi:uncharacterized protein (DUF1501 family)
MIPRPPHISRRDWFRLTAAGALGASLSGWLEALAADAAAHPQRRRSCILLWMNGGPSTIDLWDLKPGHANGGPYRETPTAVPGLRVSEHLPKLAGWAKRLAVVRSMCTRENEHERAAFHLRTGYVPQGGIQFPTFGALAAKELGRPEDDLPAYVSVAPGRGPGNLFGAGAGFLGPQFAPLAVGGDGRVPNLQRPAGVSAAEFDARLGLLGDLDRDFAADRPGPAAVAHQVAYARATRLMRTAAASAFKVGDEPAKRRDAYGRTPFGEGCLLARRLVERGVAFVEVTLDGWDTHQNNFAAVKGLSQTLDTGWSALMQDLQDRGLLDSTVIVWMGEFGRTPKINANQGRDHFPAAWSTVLAGGGIRGGQAVGRTSADGQKVEERPVSVPDLLATVCLALGIDATKTNPSNVGRPIRIVDQTAKPLTEAVG